jgi:hypothetical protein
VIGVAPPAGDGALARPRTNIPVASATTTRMVSAYFSVRTIPPTFGALESRVPRAKQWPVGPSKTRDLADVNPKRDHDRRTWRATDFLIAGADSSPNHKNAKCFGRAKLIYSSRISSRAAPGNSIFSYVGPRLPSGTVTLMSCSGLSGPKFGSPRTGRSR